MTPLTSHPHLTGTNTPSSDGAAGVFLEGAVLKGASTDAADAAVQADINTMYSHTSLL